MASFWCIFGVCHGGCVGSEGVGGFWELGFGVEVILCTFRHYPSFFRGGVTWESDA